MNNTDLPNLLWLGAYKSANFTNKGIPCVPLASMTSDERQSLEKTLQTNVRILERKPTANQTLKVVVEFIELGGDYPPKHNLATMESYFPTPDEFPHHVGDTFRAEITRKYLKCDMDSNRENVIGLKTGEYDNHFIHKVNWGSWQLVEGEQHSQHNQNTNPAQAALKVVENVPPVQKEENHVIHGGQKLVSNNNANKHITSEQLNKPQVVKVQDERQADRDARKDNSTQSIAGNIITELYRQGRFPQFKDYTDILHIGMQVKILAKVLQTTDVDTNEQLRLIHNEYVGYQENNDLENTISWG